MIGKEKDYIYNMRELYIIHVKCDWILLL
jgi:hypothetical protein